MQLPSVKQLQYLIAVNETKHFGKAAEKCFVTQSALSTGIRELENLLGVKLFERSRKQISTTPLGEMLGEQATSILVQLGQLVELAEHNNAPLSGPLRLGVIPTITPFLLPRLLPALRNEYQNIDFFLVEGLTSRLLEQLMAGDVDVILVALPHDLPGTCQMSLFEDPLMLAYHENTSLIDPESWEPDETSLESLMLLEEGHCLRDHALSKLTGGKNMQINPFTASSLSTLIHMLESDLGFSLLPAMAKDSPLLKGVGIRLRELEVASNREIALVWRENSVREDDYNAIGEFMVSRLANTE